MCGIAGAIGEDRFRAESAVAAMNVQMHARGPDDEGLWSGPTRGGQWVAIGSRRLAIIDKSPLGHQPMIDQETGVVLVYNGMTYNFRSLRSSLEAGGAAFRSASDTEVLLRLYLDKGTDSLAQLDGMFAVAIWDPRIRTLLLGRDRLGIKPLYFASVGKQFIFGSQVRALLASQVIPMRPNVASVADYLATGAAVDPRTIVEGIEAVPAAGLLTIRDGHAQQSMFWRPGWSVVDVPWRSAVHGFRESLAASVRSHLISDVPTSVFLSGGLDSSVIAAVAAKHSPGLQSVSVDFAERSFSEGPFSRNVAKHIGIQHLEVHLSQSDLIGTLPSVFAAMDQPSFDGVNTYLVAAAARQAGLKVSLSGLGADELLDGYGMSQRIRVLTLAGRLPAAIRGAPPFRRLVSSGPGRDKLRAWVSQPGDANEAHAFLRSLFLPAEVARLVPRISRRPEPDPLEPTKEAGASIDLAWSEMNSYMRNVLLRDTDCMCMANSVELRVPFLDNGVVDFVMSLPKAVRSRRKLLIVDAFRDLLPPQVLARRKHGFLLPIGPWMLSAFGDEVGSQLLRPPDLLRPLFDADAVREVWDSFRITGRRWLRPWSLFALFRWWATAEAEALAFARPGPP
jgi:asparagine synthase (glutamine-hydrolysing)